MLAKSRITDLAQGTCNLGLPCCAHTWTGPIVTGSPDCSSEGLLSARIGDIGACNCPHNGVYMIVSGSGVAEIDGRRQARIGDKVVCLVCGQSGQIIQGSPEHSSDG